MTKIHSLFFTGKEKNYFTPNVITSGENGIEPGNKKVLNIRAEP